MLFLPLQGPREVTSEC